jgi:3-hydroxybutyryl-CoA dehydrogenase
VESERIAVIGAGLMGHGIAQVFASCGHAVRLTDANVAVLAAAQGRVRANLENMTSHGIAFGAGVDETVERIQIVPELAEACAEADLVFEAVFEDLSLKQRVFVELDRLCPPETILCSNTSVISISQIASMAQRRERIIGTHFWNPPYLIPLVEVVRAQDSADWCLQAAFDLLVRAGKQPVHVHKDVPGFVGNRLQHALWREAFALIDAGICDAATVDQVIRSGFGLRLPILGPVETADMIGLDLTLSIHEYILKHLNADPTPSRTLRERVEAGKLGFKTGQGFLPWSDEEITQSRQRLVTYLVDVAARRQTQA